MRNESVRDKNRRYEEWFKAHGIDKDKLPDVLPGEDGARRSDLLIRQQGQQVEKLQTALQLAFAYDERNETYKAVMNELASAFATIATVAMTLQGGGDRRIAATILTGMHENLGVLHERWSMAYRLLFGTMGRIDPDDLPEACRRDIQDMANLCNEHSEGVQRLLAGDDGDGGNYLIDLVKREYNTSQEILARLQTIDRGGREEDIRRQAVAVLWHELQAREGKQAAGAEHWQLQQYLASLNTRTPDQELALQLLNEKRDWKDFRGRLFKDFPAAQGAR